MSATSTTAPNRGGYRRSPLRRLRSLPLYAAGIWTFLT